jgi:hypothetical protein
MFSFVCERIKIIWITRDELQFLSHLQKYKFLQSFITYMDALNKIEIWKLLDFKLDIIPMHVLPRDIMYRTRISVAQILVLEKMQSKVAIRPKSSDEWSECMGRAMTIYTIYSDQKSGSVAIQHHEILWVFLWELVLTYSVWIN